MSLRKFWKIILLSGILAGCVGQPPMEDYIMAHVAIQSAAGANSAKYASGYFNSSEQHFRQGRRDYNERNYGGAEENFQKARKLAEKAENYTVLKKAQTGEAE